MKIKNLIVTCVALGSASAMAVPDNTDNLVRALAQSNLIGEALKNVKDAVAEIKLSRVASYHKDDGIMAQCGLAALSKSGAVLKAEFVYDKKAGEISHGAFSETTYFVTAGSPKDLRVCVGAN
ncbi:MAG TPA: hypothetical protein VM901_07730 [Bdellovibrionota bacterium]|jgi:hypothetical protein|nr:hypothetical protein [Bdellovibrionota bacterium]